MSDDDVTDITVTDVTVRLHSWVDELGRTYEEAAVDKILLRWGDSTPQERVMVAEGICPCHGREFSDGGSHTQLDADGRCPACLCHWSVQGEA